MNGFYLFLPLLNIGEEHLTAASWWAFVGGTLFEIGSYLMLVEALNTGHDELFGPALWGLVTHPSHGDEKLLNGKECNSTTDADNINKSKFRWM